MDMVLTPRGLRMGNRILPCSIGRGGLTQHKREGGWRHTCWNAQDCWHALSL